MSQAKTLDPYADPRAFYGAELRRLREGAGLTQDQLGDRVFCTGSYIGQFESAKRPPQMDMSRMFDEVLRSGEHLQRLARLARTTKVADYAASAVALEPSARTISEYSPLVVPGLLQTEGYARAITRAALPFAPAEQVEGYVRTRIERQQILEGDSAPAFWSVLHEAALRVPLGGSDCMGEQLRHLAALGRSHRVMMQVLPFAASAHAFVQETFSLMTFDDAPVMVYSEGAHTGQLIDEPAVIRRFQRSYDLVRANSLSPTASLDFLESMAKDHTRR
ncbi:Scr1 family TA system antitoxin-like transcriptional regulator [Streptomyces sp. NPDC051569]|uniref:helix-turn-helix domain-containing protein n=1 Tax=Streptomyces sp. NPDC051569 TaxID=3365661 RepID=UPI00378A5174